MRQIKYMAIMLIINGGNTMETNENILEIYLKAVSRDHLIAKHRIAEKTIATYRSRLILFIRYLDEKPLKNVTSNDIKDYLADCVTKKIKVATLQARLSNIKAMFKELSYPESFPDYDFGITNVAINIKPIKGKYSHKDPVEKDDLKILSKFLESRKRDTPIDMRNHLFFSILRIYGLRVAGALGMRTSDIDFESEGIRIHYIIKGGEERSKLMPYSDTNGYVIRQVVEFKKDLKAWIKRLDSGPLFRTVVGEKWSYSAALKFFKKTCSDCGFKDKRYTPHSLRHSFVSHKLAAGVPVQTVSKLADHSSTLITLKIYSHAEENDSNDAMTIGLI